MENEKQNQLSEQDLSEGELIDQAPLETIADPAVRLAGYNQIQDFGDDTEGTLRESSEESSNK